MANPVQGLVEARLADGRVIKLLFDFNTWADAEAETGLELDELLARLSADRRKDPKAKMLTAAQQRALFWCAMKEHQPDMTLRQAGAILLECAEAMQKALAAGMPVADEDESEAGERAADDPPLTAAAGAGTNS